MPDTVYSDAAADGHVYEDDLFTRIAVSGGTTSRIGNVYNVGLDMNFNYHSFLSFNTSVYASISSATLYIYVDSYTGYLSDLVSLEKGDSVIGDSLTTDAFENAGFIFFGSATWSGTGWKSLAITDCNLTGDTDFELLVSPATGETKYLTIRQTEYGGGSKPYLLIDGVLRGGKRVKGVRLFPRVNLIRPVRLR